MGDKVIKVVGYIDPGDLDPSWVDLNHELGLSEEGYIKLPHQLHFLGNITTSVVDEDDVE